MWPSAARTWPSAVMTNHPPALVVNGSVEVPTRNRCVQFPEASVISTTVEAVAGGVLDGVGQVSRVVTGLPLSSCPQTRLLIRAISQFRPPSAAARAPVRSRSARARP